MSFIALVRGVFTFQRPDGAALGQSALLIALSPTARGAGALVSLIAAVSLLPATASAGFITTSTAAAGPFPASPKVVDVNRDGIPDLVVANHYQDTVTVLLGKGDGTFQAPQSFPAGANVQGQVVGDFDGDGNADVAVTHLQGTVSILLGQGDGTFKAPQSFPLGPNTDVVAVGDFDGDGRLDLAGFGWTRPTEGAIYILLGNGDGTFRLAQTFPTSSCFAIAVGDFNGDNQLDLVLTTFGAVRLFLGNGDGSFGTAQDYAVASATSMALGDFNGDGHLDLAVGTKGDSNLMILLGNGDGSFQPAQASHVGALTKSLVVGDFNGDGILDLAVGHHEGGVSIVLGNGDGTFQAGPRYDIGSSGSTASLVVADFNGDDLPDLAAVGPTAAVSLRPPLVSVLLGQGHGIFYAAASYALGTHPYLVRTADFNNDGFLDLVVADNDSTVNILLGKGDGTFQTPVRLDGGPGLLDLVVGDFNGDGKLDFVTANYYSILGPRNTYLVIENDLRVYLGNGDGTFQAPKTIGSAPSSMKVADLNGDGYLDLVTVDQAGGISMLLGNGDGTFAAGQRIAFPTATGLGPIADYNGDGRPDLLVVSYPDPTQGATATVLLGNGDGTFRSGQSVALGGYPSLAVGDFNGDGIPDLVVSSNSDGTVSVLLGNGTGSFQAAQTYHLGNHPGPVAVADFNGDGILDVIVDLGYEVAVLLGNGDGSFQAAQHFSGGTHGLAVGDFNGDQLPDVAQATWDDDCVTVLLNAADWGR